MDLKLSHCAKDGVEVVDAEGEIDICTAPQLHELLTDLADKDNYQLVVSMDRVGFLDSADLGVLVGGVKRVRARGGALDLACTRERLLKIFQITGMTNVHTRRPCGVVVPMPCLSTTRSTPRSCLGVGSSVNRYACWTAAMPRNHATGPDIPAEIWRPLRLPACQLACPSMRNGAG